MLQKGVDEKPPWKYLSIETIGREGRSGRRNRKFQKISKNQK